jgi:hypothetical protein
MSLTHALLTVVGVMILAVPGLTWRLAKSAKTQLQQAEQKHAEIDKSLRAALQEIRDLAGQTALLNQKRADRDSSALAYITGESSFCYVDPSICSADANRWFPVVVQQGNYPCYDVDIRIVDLHKLQTVDDSLPVYERQHYTDRIFSVGTMPPKRIKILNDDFFSTAHEEGFNIYITARNGYYLQQLRFVNVGKERKCSYQIKQYRKGSFSKMIRRYSEPGYPKQKNPAAIDC